MISDIKRKTLPAISRVVIKQRARTTAFPYRITLESVSMRGKIKADFTSISRPRNPPNY